MAKKSGKHLSSHRRLQAGCVSGLLNIFDFRHGRSTRRMLSDGRPSIKQTPGHSCDGRVNLGHAEGSERTKDPEKTETPMIDGAKTSVKELMEEDMLNEGGGLLGDCGTTSVIVENHLKMNRTKKAQLQSVSEPDAARLGDLDEAKTSDSRIQEIIEEQLSQIDTERFLNNDFPGLLDMLSAQAVTVTDKKLVATVKLLMEQKLSNLRNCEEASPSSCEEIMDAVRIFTANYGLFLELLQESKALQINPITDRTPSSPSASNVLGTKPAEFDGHHSHEQQSFSRKRSKSLGCHSSHIILKPSSDSVQNSETNMVTRNASLPSFQMYNNVQGERGKWFQFSFTEFKRKLWHAMVKEKTSDRLMLQYSSAHQNRKNSRRHGLRENLGWSSPNRNHFYTERFALSSPGRDGEKTWQCRRHGGFNIDSEAKKHISKMLKNVDENGDSMTRQMPMSLGRILSDPVNSREFQGDASTSEGWFLHEDQDNHQRTGGDAGDDKMCLIEASSCIPENLSIHQEDKMSTVLEEKSHMASQSSFSMVAESTEVLESRPENEGEIVNALPESCVDIQDAGSTETSNEDNFFRCSESSQCQKSDSREEDRIFSSSSVSTSHSSGSRDLEYCENFIDKLEQPSPVSVLESLFMDDACSPASTISEPAREVEPQSINFEEPCSASGEGLCTRISMEVEESPFEYVEAVLLGSGLDWNEFHLRWLSSHEILDSSLFEEVELFSNRPRHDQRLLFDCANEALMSVCNTCFGCLTCKKDSTIESFCSSMDLINEIWRQVEWHLFHQVQAKSLDQLVMLDLAKTGKWINFEPDIKLIGFEIEESILNEVIEDSIRNFEKGSSPHEPPPVIVAVESIAAAAEDTSL